MEQRPSGSIDTDVESPNDFTERLVDGFFRRWVLYLLPVAAFIAIGVYSTRSITADYASYARLSATSNPYLAETTIRGTEIGLFEGPGDATARLINEQLRTDAFIDDVAERAGLKEAIDSEAITRLELRNQIGATGLGQNTLEVSAGWTDPDTAFRLANGTVEGYTQYLQAIAGADSLEAVEFWTGQLEDATAQVQEAEDSLDQYLARIPPLAEGQSQPIAQELDIQRLNGSLDRALEDQSDAQSAVDEAQLTAIQAARTAARELTVIDAAERAAVPESIRRDQITAIAVYTLLGLLIAFAALVLSTVADRAVRTRSQLTRATGISSVVVVPRIKQPRQIRRPSRETSDQVA